jgi:hypothetical protein
MPGICCEVERFDYRLSAGQFPQNVQPTPAKPPGEHIPLGGFVRNRRSIMVRKSRWSFKDDRRLLELARASTSLEQVAKITGRSPKAVKKAAVRLGISFQSQVAKK